MWDPQNVLIKLYDICEIFFIMPLHEFFSSFWQFDWNISCTHYCAKKCIKLIRLHSLSVPFSVNFLKSEIYLCVHFNLLLVRMRLKNSITWWVWWMNGCSRDDSPLFSEWITVTMMIFLSIHTKRIYKLLFIDWIQYIKL